MNSEQKFWVAIWATLGTVLLLLVALGTYAGGLDDKRDLVFADKGLQKYKVTRCIDVSTKTEWHAAGWRDNYFVVKGN